MTGFSLAMMMLAGMLTCPIWYYLSLKVGKVKTWQAASFLQSLLYITLGFSAENGQVGRTMAFCGLIGVGAGAWFLNNSILSDIIDYNQFLTVRNPLISNN